MVDNMWWYMSPEGIKEMFESSNQYDNLKSKLLYEGIIFEYDFGGLATSQFIEYAGKSLDYLFGDYDEFNSRNYIGIGHEVKGNGRMYCLYDSNEYNIEQIKKMLDKKFSID